MKQGMVPTYQLLKCKEKKSIEILYARYGRKLLKYAMTTWKLDEDAATDIVYQVLFKTVDSIEKYSFASEEKFASFVFTLFMNFLKNFHRDQKRKREQVEITYNDDMEKMGFINEDSDIGCTNPRMAVLQEVLEKFEDWERMLLLLRAQDMPYSEIAKYVDKPEEQLKVYHQRLKQKLTEKMNAVMMKNIEQNV